MSSIFTSQSNPIQRINKPVYKTLSIDSQGRYVLPSADITIERLWLLDNPQYMSANSKTLADLQTNIPIPKNYCPHIIPSISTCVNDPVSQESSNLPVDPTINPSLKNLENNAGIYVKCIPDRDGCVPGMIDFCPAGTMYDSDEQLCLTSCNQKQFDHVTNRCVNKTSYNYYGYIWWSLIIISLVGIGVYIRWLKN